MASAIHKHESVISIHVSPPSWTPSHLPPHPIPPGCHRAPALGALCHTINSHWLSILHSEMKVTHSCLTLCDPMDSSPWNSPGQNTGVGTLSLLQGIFPTQGSNPGLPHCRQILYQMSYQGSPRNNAIWSNTDGTRDYHTKQSQTEKDKYHVCSDLSFVSDSLRPHRP